MLLQVEEFKDSCRKILSAVDTDSTVKNVVYGYDTLELEAVGKTLNFNVSNGEYYVGITMPLEEESDFRAVVEAKLFLALISKITTKTLELEVTENTLIVKANGTYKFPLKCDAKGMLVLPKLDIHNVTERFTISGKILNSILVNNSREIEVDNPNLRKVQKMYYLDNEGCLTFKNSSACVNSFKLMTTVKLLLPAKLVRLFKLFKETDEVAVTLGLEDVGTTTMTKINMTCGNVSITSILDPDADVNTVPVGVVRGRATKAFDYKVTLEKKTFLEVLDRLLLFNTDAVNKGVGVFEFGNTAVTIYDVKKVNSETIAYAGEQFNDCNYTARLDFETIKDVLLTSQAEMFTIEFGDGQAITVSYDGIKNVVSEKKYRE